MAGEEIEPARLRDGRPGGRGRAPTSWSARASAGCSSRSTAAATWSATSPSTSACPLVVAASPGLGTINHTLLTIEAARAAGLEVAAVVLTPWPEQPSEIERSNRETIAALGEVEVKTLPSLDLADPGHLAEPLELRDDDVEVGAGELDLEAGVAGDRRRPPRGLAGAFRASSSARATSPRTAFAM